MSDEQPVASLSVEPKENVVRQHLVVIHEYETEFEATVVDIGTAATAHHEDESVGVPKFTVKVLIPAWDTDEARNRDEAIGQLFMTIRDSYDDPDSYRPELDEEWPEERDEVR